MTMDYKIVGIVPSIGDKVHNLKAGDRVTVSAILFEDELDGNDQAFGGFGIGHFTGFKQFNGGQAGSVRVPFASDNLLLLPEGRNMSWIMSCWRIFSRPRIGRWMLRGLCLEMWELFLALVRFPFRLGRCAGVRLRIVQVLWDCSMLILPSFAEPVRSIALIVCLSDLKKPRVLAPSLLTSAKEILSPRS
jgi:hypothetical protein